MDEALTLSDIFPLVIEGIDERKIQELQNQCEELLRVLQSCPGDLRLNALKRYLRFSDHYLIDRDFVKFLQKNILSGNEKSFLDLGCASGDLLAEIRGERTDMVIKGVDINPRFVITANKKGIDADVGCADRDLTHLEGKLFDCVITNLTLDRVADPMKLLENVIKHTKIGGKFVIGTLLPINSSDHKFAYTITEYTEPDKKLTQGKRLGKDKKEITQIMKNTFQQDITIVQYSYVHRAEVFGHFYVMWGVRR